MDTIKYAPPAHPLQSVNPDLKKRLIRAQSNLLELEFGSAGELVEKALSDLRIKCPVSRPLYESPLSEITNQTYGDLTRLFSALLSEAGFPEQSIPLHAVNLSQRLQLIQAFDAPDVVIANVEEKIGKIVDRFPQTAADIERGRNPGDVIDPYILAATQYLLTGGDFEEAVGITVGHKALMMIEGLIGHLHEDVIGMMRGNVRSPEPRGVDQEALDLIQNPFPGADVVQPPWSDSRSIHFHQLKSKTGSAKGGDGKRLGEQLRRLQEYYGGEIYYHALIGNTLRGHRSRTAVERAAPNVVVLVGSASFRELTASEIGPQLLLRVYQTSFTTVANKRGYLLNTMVSGIVATFTERAIQMGDGFLESILADVTNGPGDQQDSRIQKSSKKLVS
jgi:hypothetical protein